MGIGRVNEGGLEVVGGLKWGFGVWDLGLGEWCKEKLGSGGEEGLRSVIEEME